MIRYNIRQLKLFAEPMRKVDLSRTKRMQDGRLESLHPLQQDFAVLAPKNRQPQRRMLDLFHAGT